MALLLATYDLTSDIDPAKVADHIKETFGESFVAELSKTSYAIKTSLTPEEVLKECIPMVDKSNNFMVIALGGTPRHVGRSVSGTMEFLQDNL